MNDREIGIELRRLGLRQCSRCKRWLEVRVISPQTGMCWTWGDCMEAALRIPEEEANLPSDDR